MQDKFAYDVEYSGSPKHSANLHPNKICVQNLAGNPWKVLPFFFFGRLSFRVVNKVGGLSTGSYED